jgi:hypothetical protein
MPENCFECENELPEGQSFYEDHGVKVCLACFREAPRCKSCKFPTKKLQLFPLKGQICPFCVEELHKDSGMECYLCSKKIAEYMSHYSDHDKYVCQECFKDARVRCFMCRFPHSVETVNGLGGVCEFCQPKMLGSDEAVQPLLQPLSKFMKGLGHPISQQPEFQWMNWNILMGMQRDEPPEFKVSFLDEMLRHCYPIFYMGGTFYSIPRLNPQLFMTYMSGQVTARDICRKYDVQHLKGNGPFHKLARGWCQYISLLTARRLKYEKLSKLLTRWPDGEIPGDFAKFEAMSEFRKLPDIINQAQKLLDDHAKRYL